MRLSLLLLTVLSLSQLLGDAAFAGDPRFPLDHRLPSGTAAHWNVIARHDYGATQLVEVVLPTAGRVTFFDGSSPRGTTVDAPGRVRLVVGHVYRIRINDMPDYPGVELYPSIELVDHLNPPPGLEDEFPLPIDLTSEEIEAAAEDRMVHKVIYLERRDLPRTSDGGTGVSVADVPPRSNLLEAAQHLGRPMAIVRLGGRTPAPNDPYDLMQSPAPQPPVPAAFGVAP